MNLINKNTYLFLITLCFSIWMLFSHPQGDDELVSIFISLDFSVKSSNSQDIIRLENVDGCLIGGSSLKVDEFNTIIS